MKSSNSSNSNLRQLGRTLKQGKKQTLPTSKRGPSAMQFDPSHKRSELHSPRLKKIRSASELHESSSCPEDISVTPNNRLAVKNILSSKTKSIINVPEVTLQGFDFDWTAVKTLIIQQLRKHFESTEKKVSTLEQLVNFHDLQVKKHERIFDEVQLAVFRKRLVPDKEPEYEVEGNPVRDSRALDEELSVVKTPTSTSVVDAVADQVVVDQKSSEVSNVPEPSMDKHRILFQKMNDLYMLEKYTPIDRITHNLIENKD